MRYVLAVALVLTACATAPAQPSPAQPSYNAFIQLLDEGVRNGTITPAQANFAAHDYARRLWLEQQQLEAAQDSADAARLGNALGVWRSYFGPRRY